ncbi:CUB domain [Cinara cedri]|uniref:CUB domain n=1 Tax=Cinara cedri TaxID=506608 RepID=A0A5E4M2U0_9HEMI|nr:CUB domain [Cinara cedri]
MNESTNCEVKIVKTSFDSRHQIRLDFVDFNLSTPPTANTLVCENDRLIVTSKSSSDLTVCGLYSDEHLYYTLDDDSDVAIIKFITSNIDYDRSWKIKITRVDPSEEIPIGCLQYYPNATGILQTTKLSVNGQFLANTDFKICIKRAESKRS